MKNAQITVENTVLNVEYDKTAQNFDTGTCIVWFDVDQEGGFTGLYGVKHDSDGDITLVDNEGTAIDRKELLDALAPLVTDHMLSA